MEYRAAVKGKNHHLDDIRKTKCTEGHRKRKRERKFKGAGKQMPQISISPKKKMPQISTVLEKENGKLKLYNKLCI
jgi:hypothetical protein